MSSGVPGPCFYLNISLKSQCLTSVLSLATEKKIWLLYFQVPISIRQAQEVMWYLKCAEQRSQQLLNVLERGVKSINLLGESLSQQRPKCLISGPPGLWLALCQLLLRSSQDIKQERTIWKATGRDFSRRIWLDTARLCGQGKWHDIVVLLHWPLFSVQYLFSLPRMRPEIPSGNHPRPHDPWVCAM